MKAFIALILALCFAWPAQAWEVYKDPALAGSNIIVASAVTSDQTSGIYATVSGDTSLLIAVDVTICVSSCLFRVWLEQGLPDGTWITHQVVGTTMDLSAVSKKEFLFGIMPGPAITDSGYEMVKSHVGVPGLWRVRAVWTSGGAATYTVSAASW